jgi:hypothetical protein
LDTVLSNGDILGQTGQTLRVVLMSKVLTTGLGIDMVIEILCTGEMRDRARKRGEVMHYDGSMTGGSRATHAALAEIAVVGLVGGEIHDTFDYDIMSNIGFKVDVKNKLVSQKPRPFYEVSIMGNNDKQDCDYLVFTMTPRDGSCVWLCGGYYKPLFIKVAEFKPAGTTTGFNDLVYKRDNYVMSMSKLDDPEFVVKFLSGDHWVDIKCGDIEARLRSVTSLDELYGFANRRKVLGVDLPKWTDEERRLILARKYELEKANAK